MTYNEYVERRAGLVDEANQLISDAKFEDSEAKMNEIKDLDAQWDKIAEAQANLEALDGEKRVVKMEKQETAPKAPVKTASVQFVPVDMDDEDEGARMYASREYAVAFATAMMGKPLTDRQKEVIGIVNEYTHTSTTHGVVIPQTVSTAMWDKIEQAHPYYADVTKTFVKGGVTILLDGEESEATFYDEATPTADGTQGVDSLVLNAYDLARNVKISWKLKEMAIDDFLAYIESRMAKKIGDALGYAVIHGAGTDENEPTGVVTALEAETGTPQVLTYTAGSLDFATVTAGRGKIAVDAQGAAIYANNATIWNELSKVEYGDGKPAMVPDPAVPGAYRMLGLTVKEEAGLRDGEVLISSAATGYHMNINRDLSLLSQDDVVKRQTIYAGYALVDGGVTYSKCHALLKYKA